MVTILKQCAMTRHVIVPYHAGDWLYMNIRKITMHSKCISSNLLQCYKIHSCSSKRYIKTHSYIYLPPTTQTYLWAVDSMRRTDPRWTRDRSGTPDCDSGPCRWRARRTPPDRGRGTCCLCMQVGWGTRGGWSTRAGIQRRGRLGGRADRCRPPHRPGPSTARLRRRARVGRGHGFQGQVWWL